MLVKGAMGGQKTYISIGFEYVQTYRHGENACGNMMIYLHISWLVRDNFHNYGCEYELCYSMSAGHMPAKRHISSIR